ncbi:hypothetical protein [Streptomyces sp. NPDC002156]
MAVIALGRHLDSGAATAGARPCPQNPVVRTEGGPGGVMGVPLGHAQLYLAERPAHRFHRRVAPGAQHLPYALRVFPYDTAPERACGDRLEQRGRGEIDALGKGREGHAGHPGSVPFEDLHGAVVRRCLGQDQRLGCLPPRARRVEPISPRSRTGRTGPRWWG